MAAPADVQKRSLPDWVVVADEVALTLTDILDVVDNASLSPAIAPVLARITTRIDEMSSGEHDDVWTTDALDRAPEWEELRRLAREALTSMSVPYAEPNLAHLTFVPQGVGISDWIRARWPTRFGRHAEGRKPPSNRTGH